MSADRETSHDMTHRDIALLLADAADEVEIGIAPYQAVVRGGRRRKARRWAIEAAVALVIAGSTGTLALAGGTGGDGRSVEPAGPSPASVTDRHVDEPQVTTLAMGTDQGTHWEVTVEVWGAPRNKSEAQLQLARMSEYGVRPGSVREASDLIGKSWRFGSRVLGDKRSVVIEGEVKKDDDLSGTDLVSYAMPLDADASGSNDPANRRLVIGRVAATAERVTCTWDDGTTTDVHRATTTDFNSDDKPAIRSLKGSSSHWFVCLAPQGRAYDSVKVTR